MIIMLLTAALVASRRSVAGLRTQLVALQNRVDAERRRLSHELHDDVGQKLIALKLRLQLSRLPGATSAATHAESVALLDTVIADVRALSQGARPAPFDAGQLIAALTTLAKAEAGRAGICVLVDAPEEDVALGASAELACYRAVREALANIVKHARARNVAVTLRREAEHLSIVVADDGRGFDPEPVARRALRRGRLGLAGMREGVVAVGGTLEIESRAGSGTTVVCRIPLEAA